MAQFIWTVEREGWDLYVKCLAIRRFNAVTADHDARRRRERRAGRIFESFARPDDRLLADKKIAENPLHGHIAAVSVGIYDGVPVLDLDYAEDSAAETDMNVVMNEAGAFIEVQGTAEGHAFRREEFDAMLNLAAAGIAEICHAQINTLVQWREAQG